MPLFAALLSIWMKLPIGSLKTLGLKPSQWTLSYPNCPVDLFMTQSITAVRVLSPGPSGCKQRPQRCQWTSIRSTRANRGSPATLRTSQNCKPFHSLTFVNLQQATSAKANLGRKQSFWKDWSPDVRTVQTKKIQSKIFNINLAY